MIKSYGNTPADMLALKEMGNRKFATTDEMGDFQV